MAFKMNNAPFEKHKPGHKGKKTGHVPSYKLGDDLKEHFLAKRASKTEGKFEQYLEEGGSVESPKGDRLEVKAGKAADAHQAYTDKRAKKAVAKNERKKNKGKNKVVAPGSTREDRRKENKREREQNRADRKANRKNK